MSAAGPGHSNWQDFVAPYVLGAVEPGEKISFEQHMAGCPACRDEADALRRPLEALALAAPPLAPPRELGRVIMDTVELEAEILRAAGPAADRPQSALVKRVSWRERFGLQELSPAFALAATLLILALGAVSGAVFSTNRSPDEPPQSRIVAGKVMDVARAPNADVRLQLSSDGAMLVAERLPQPPKGRVYQVWLKRPNSKPRPTDALFMPRKNGSATAAIRGGVGGVEAVLVSDEPPGGSPNPTSKPLLLVPTSA